MKENFKIIPINERPREKAIYYGIENLSNEELLSIILRCGNKSMNVLELSSFIMKKYMNFNNLINCSYEELIEINGINKAKAIEIMSIIEIIKRVQKNKINQVKKITNPDEIYEYFKYFVKEEKQEIFMVIFLNIKSHIIKYEKLFVGGINYSIVDINLIFKKAMNYGASKIICLHNHPSGDSSPSDQDIYLTKKIIKISDLTGIKLLDHIIIGKNNYTSLKKQNYI